VNSRNVLIIGAGPAGVTTAIQLRRYDIGVVLVEKEEIGGLLRNANLVENYPGFPDGISGMELVGLFKRQLESAGVSVSFEEVLELEYEDSEFHAKTNERVVMSDIVVIASGTKPKPISDLKISKAVEERMFHVIHPIRGLSGKEIAIIGAGDAAFDYALGMSQRNEVTILNRSSRAKCIPVLWDRCMESRNVTYLDRTCVQEIRSDGNKAVLTCVHNDEQKKREIRADYVVIAIGREPCLDFLGSGLKRKVETLTDSSAIHMVGDVRNGIYRQVAICVGDGLRAAMEIHSSVAGEGE